MAAEVKLPPMYRLVSIRGGQDARAEACRQAAAGAAPGTVVWSDEPDSLDCAVVLAPACPYREALLAGLVAVVALGDTLAAAVPPGADISFEWPGRIRANGGLVAEVRLDLPEGARPPAAPGWLVVSAAVAMRPHGSGDYDAGDLERTNLLEEGCRDATAADVLTSFARYLLTWINRWQEDGFEPVRRSWINRTPERGAALEVETAAGRVAGKLVSLADDGALVLEAAGGRRRTFALSETLRH